MCKKNFFSQVLAVLAKLQMKIRRTYVKVERIINVSETQF